jgi:hypothetical protein
MTSTERHDIAEGSDALAQPASAERTKGGPKKSGSVR